MGSRVTRIAVPAIGAVAATAALALVIAAPFALFPSADKIGPIAAPPDASGEVTHVTAPPLGERKPSSPPVRTTPSPTEPGATSPPGSSAADDGSATQTDERAAPRPRDGRSPTARPRAPAGDDHPGKGNAKGKGNGEAKGHEAKGHDKPKHEGLAKGHHKPKHHGKAKGRAKH